MTKILTETGGLPKFYETTYSRVFNVTDGCETGTRSTKLDILTRYRKAMLIIIGPKMSHTSMHRHISPIPHLI